MPRFLFSALVALSLMGSSVALAEEEPKKEPKEAEEKIRRILITEIVNNGVEAPWVPLVVEHVAQNLSKGDNIEALTMSDLAEVAKFAATQQSLNCTERLACVSEMSKYVNAPEVIQGRIGKIGKEYLITLVLVDAAKATPLERVSLNFTDADPIEEIIDQAVATLMHWEKSEKVAFKLAEGEAVSLAVFDLNTAGVSDSIASNLTQILTSVVKETPGSSVINRDDITAMLQLESEKQMLGCSDDMSCIAEIGGALGVDKIVVGQVGKVSRQYVVSLRLMNPSSAKVENRVLESFKGEETSLLQAMKHAGRRLMGLKAEQPGILAVSTSQPKAELILDGNSMGFLPMPPIKDLSPGRHSIRVVKNRFFEYEADVYVEPGDMTSQYVELKKIPVKFIELPQIVWWGVMGVGALAATGGGVFYFLKEESVTNFNQLVEGSRINGSELTPLLQKSKDYESQGNVAFIAAASLAALGLGLTPFVVWEE